MLEAETFHPSELSPADAVAWRAMCAARPEFESPLLGPGFAQAVGEVRQDARVTVWREAGRPVAFLAHHRRPGGLARPIGSPLSDYHALISQGAIDVPSALERAGLGGWRFTGLLDPFRAFESHCEAPRQSYVLKLTGSVEDYLEQIRARSAKRFKNYRRLGHKLEREVGPMRMVVGDRDPAALVTLIDWKRAQFARTGGEDFLSPDWTRALMWRLFETDGAEFGGLMVNLYVGDKLAVGHFGVRAGPVYHPWIASADPELAAWSPGQLFFLQAIAAMPSAGLTTYDLGPGHDHYKAPFALAGRSLSSGWVAAAGPAGRRMRTAERMLQLVGANGEGAVGRLRRRLDTIASLELSVPGRVRKFATAVVGRMTAGPAEAA
ncbi:MAG: GNAT family N-acetyltransferase [Phenylobacterium sp.]|nr:GNAT family N-acetyltransferase [Phenylobacterium sp.]